MPISTVKYQNTFDNAMFKRFWTLFSLGAPEIYRREEWGIVGTKSLAD